MNKELKSQINQACLDLFGKSAEVDILRPDEKFGDFSTNLALKLSKQLEKPPREIAEALASELKKSDNFSRVEVAGPGFINLTLNDDTIFDAAIKADKLEKTLDGSKVVAEYSDPNPFKVLHAGHLYTSIVGDTISNIFEAAGAKVHRVNYGGDVGLHVAKAVWAVLKDLGGEKPDNLDKIDAGKRADWLADRYVAGNEAYETDEQAKTEIAALNKRIYKVSTDKDTDSPLGKIYWDTRQWSYDYFDEFYARLKIKFEKYYPESTVAELGLKTVLDKTPDVYSKSDGAIVYEGEKDGLHTRVFITKEGLPTYEAKEVGLLLTKNKEYGFDRSVVITANEISQYMQVVLASVARFEPELVKRTTHLTHGIVKLPGAEKMSSRKGNLLKAVDILESAEGSAKKLNTDTAPEVVIGAVKYSFLKSGLGGDIIFDAKESVGIEGNSGPYLQYALVRAASIIKKVGIVPDLPDHFELNDTERSLARKISMFPEVFNNALDELSPHHICTYLYELSQVFNRFYETNRVIGDERSPIRLKLVEAYAAVLQSGLGILGVEKPERM